MHKKTLCKSTIKKLNPPIRILRNSRGMVVLNLSGSIARILLLTSFLPTPGGPTSTTGRKKPDRGNSLATASYVATSSRSKSSESAK